MSRVLASQGSQVSPHADAPRAGRWSEEVALVGITLVAFGLRVFHLGTQSMWGDETISVFRAYAPLAEITETVRHEATLPPLYYYLLHYWIRVAGDRETGARFLSLWLGVLAIPLLYVLVRRTLGPAVALTAAALAALSPFWIFYSQETRTYALVTTLVILAVYLLVRAGTDPSWTTRTWPWAAYSVAAAAAIASHYFAGFALAAAASWVLLDRQRWPAVALRCVLAQAGALALITPLLIYAGPSMYQAAGSVARASIPLRDVMAHVVAAFAVGTSVNPHRVVGSIALALGLAMGGLITSRRRQSALWSLLLVVPVLAVFAVSFVPHAGWERYFITASPSWYALVAAGLLAVARATAAAVASITSALTGAARPAIAWAAAGALTGLSGAGLLLGIAPSLHNYYFDPAYWRNDLRGAERPVETPATREVAVIVNGPPQFPSFFYYFQKTIPWLELPAPGASGAQTLVTLDRLARTDRGLWLVKYHPPDYDPGNYVEVWLDQHAYLVSSRWVENLTYSFYVTEDPTSPRVVASTPIDRRFGDDATLVAYRATIVRAQGGDYLLVTLTWRALRTPRESDRVFAHLLDRQGRIITQSDHFPEADLRPTSTWHAGDMLDDRFGLRLPPIDARQGLQLEVGLYHPDGTRLPIQGDSSPGRSLLLPL